jgi:hypothetical protein
MNEMTRCIVFVDGKDTAISSFSTDNIPEIGERININDLRNMANISRHSLIVYDMLWIVDMGNTHTGIFLELLCKDARKEDSHEIQST